jgi:hypothetical protein
VSDTPRTDAKAQFFGWNPEEGEEFVQADFARELERENAALRSALVEAINKRAETMEWRTDHPTTTGMPERWVRDELCIKWRAAIDAAKKESGDDAIMRQHLTEGGTPT